MSLKSGLRRCDEKIGSFIANIRRHEMTEPTLESRNEAARAAGFTSWSGVEYSERHSTHMSIRAHALTLDELHGRNEASEAETFYLAVMRLSLGSSDWGVDRSQLGHLDKDAIALIEAKFAELRGERTTRGDA